MTVIVPPAPAAAIGADPVASLSSTGLMRGIRNPAPSRLSAVKLGRADVCVVGAGAAGCVLAARLSERGDRSVCLVEAGPDYGHHDAGRWPADLLDASDCATSHDWGYGADCRAASSAAPPRTTAASSCGARRPTTTSGRRRPGDEAWGWAGMAPLLARAEAAIGTRAGSRRRGGRVHARGAAPAGQALGEPALDDFNHRDADARRRPGARQPPRPHPLERRAGVPRPRARPAEPHDRRRRAGRPRGRRRGPGAGVVVRHARAAA